MLPMKVRINERVLMNMEIPPLSEPVGVLIADRPVLRRRQGAEAVRFAAHAAAKSEGSLLGPQVFDEDLLHEAVVDLAVGRNIVLHV